VTTPKTVAVTPQSVTATTHVRTQYVLACSECGPLPDHYTCDSEHLAIRAGKYHRGLTSNKHVITITPTVSTTCRNQ